MRLTVLGTLVSTLCLSLAECSLITRITISSEGQIIAFNVTAESGSATHIQAAIDLIVANGGVGNVIIPEGIFNFVEIGEPWVTVTIPAGVNLFGAPTAKDVNGQVINWKTVLVMPYEVPTSGPDDNPAWFRVQLGGHPERDFRFSDIELVGWRYFDYLQNGEPSWTIPYDPNNPGDRGSQTMYIGLRIYDSPYDTPHQTGGIQNFRVDHCDFQDMGGSAVWLGPGETVYNWHVISGVLDHNRFVNSYGDPGRLGSSDYQYRTLGYGVGMRRWASDLWDPNLDNIAGHYLDYSIHIEDNYFSKWRHCTCANDGIHTIVRHNTFDGSYGVGDVDGHGSLATTGREYAVGTRLQEIYDNVWQNPAIGIWDPEAWCINVRGGSAIIFNNTVTGYTGLIALNNEVGNEQYQPKCSCGPSWIWNNDLGGAALIWYDYHGGTKYYRAPNLADDGFDYTAYAYPHPLTLGV